MSQPHPKISQPNLRENSSGLEVGSRSLPSFQTASDMKRSEGRLFDRPLIIAGHICSATENEARGAWKEGWGEFCHPERGETSKIASSQLSRMLVGFPPEIQLTLHQGKIELTFVQAGFQYNLGWIQYKSRA